MDEREWLAERFQAHRPRLRAVAYRMLGSTSEADDAVQSTTCSPFPSTRSAPSSTARPTRRASSPAADAAASAVRTRPPTPTRPRGLVAWPALINGAAGWVSLLDGEVYAVAALTLRNGRIATMDILLDPARLARLDLTAFDSRRHGGD
jgi:hypothetical protein